MARFASLLLCHALAAGLALPAAADRSEDKLALRDLAESSCTLADAVESALAVTPGSASKARLERSRKPGRAPVWFYKVVVLDDQGDRSVQRFAPRSCEAVELVPPVLDMSEAIAAALAELGAGFPVASKLRFPGLEPVYRVVALLPRAKMVVYVDGVTGEILAARKWSRRLDAAEEAAGEDAEDGSL